MLKPIDNFLNAITMYRLIFYYLIGLLGIGLVLCLLNVLPYNPGALLLSTGLITAVCWVTNTIFSKVFKVPANVESAFISAFILALIITPAKTDKDLVFMGWAAVLAMASKYILAINGKHVFNPVAVAVALTALILNQNASWWVGTTWMLPFVVVGGALIVHKIRRGNLVGAFIGTALLVTAIGGALSHDNLLTLMQHVILDTPLLFFAAVIVTEPLTTPPTSRLQLMYSVIVGLLFFPQLHIGSFYLTPELAIVFGNVFSYIVSPKAKLMLRLKEKIRVGADIYDFVFVPNRKLVFAPGQYMEWTLGHNNPDNRGNRRYFTLASSPTENTLRLGVKIYQKSSTYKKSLLNMTNNTQIVAAQLAGDFTLPEDPKQPCVFIAGGIGITPFRSMIKYLVDKRQKRRITLFYANRVASEIVYKDVFDQAQRDLGIKTIYTLTDTKHVAANWTGKTGHITPEMIKTEVSDYVQCHFYLSGPNSMVNAFETLLLEMGVPHSHIKTDFFPGLA
jgi:ferredoxin-NADP reductase